MENSILDFNKQFDYQPEIINSDKLTFDYKNFVLGGMGGSHLSADILKIIKPEINLYVFSDYDLPKFELDFYKKSLFIASSYSGNTEETLDFADQVYSQNYPLLIIATGGKLIDFAKKNNVAYIQIPDTGIQPRLAVGFSLIALTSVVFPELLPELKLLKEKISPISIKQSGKDLAESLYGKVLVIYTNLSNKSIGYNWKIKLNETAKIPAFHNVFPELNHNEMQGYGFDHSDLNNLKKFHFIFINDSEQNPRITKRMQVTEQLLQKNGYDVINLFLEGENKLIKIFNSILLADWTAYHLAISYGFEPEQVPLIEEFKKLIK